MKIDFGQLLEGWRNNLIPPSNIKELIKKVGEERMAICEQCPHHSKNHKTIRPDAHCTNCGCTLAAKTKCLSCECPIKKWMPAATGKQSEELKKHESGCRCKK